MPFWVYGLDRETGSPTEPMFSEADSEVAARSEAAAQGMDLQLVHEVLVDKEKQGPRADEGEHDEIAAGRIAEELPSVFLPGESEPALFGPARFTEQAARVMQLANQETQRFGHEYIGTEHILLGLVKEDLGIAAHILKNHTIDYRKVRREVEKIVQYGAAGSITSGERALTPKTKQVIAYAIEEADNLHHPSVNVEHLLLGLLREQEGVAAQILESLGLSLDEARQEVQPEGARRAIAPLVTHPDGFYRGAPTEKSDTGLTGKPAEVRTGSFNLPRSDDRLSESARGFSRKRRWMAVAAWALFLAVVPLTGLSHAEIELGKGGLFVPTGSVLFAGLAILCLVGSLVLVFMQLASRHTPKDHPRD